MQLFTVGIVAPATSCDESQILDPAVIFGPVIVPLISLQIVAGATKEAICCLKAVRLALSLCDPKLTKITAARIPMMAMTIKSSTSVKPF